MAELSSVLQRYKKVEKYSLHFNLRLWMPLSFALLACIPATRQLTLQALSDAYFQVAAFVYASLALYYLATHRVTPEMVSRFVAAHPVYEVGLAAGLGALPGCGGAIIVVTQYSKGASSFGAVVAVLTSTMGDAAFLLIAQSPIDGITVLAISVVTGMFSGLIVNRLHNYRAEMVAMPIQDTAAHQPKEPKPKLRTANYSSRFWLIMIGPSLFIATLLAFQIDVSELLGVSASTLELLGSVLAFSCITLWALNNDSPNYSSVAREEECAPPINWRLKSAMDTQFVLAWVVVAFLLFELLVFGLNLDLSALFHSMGPLVVGIAILIGLLPGCGPQILVTSLYLNGAIPFSAQLGNAISNDGDALFPAIALSPRAAALATLYSAIPAALVGYGYWFIFE